MNKIIKNLLTFLGFRQCTLKCYNHKTNHWSWTKDDSCGLPIYHPKYWTQHGWKGFLHTTWKQCFKDKYFTKYHNEIL